MFPSPSLQSKLQPGWVCTRFEHNQAQTFFGGAITDPNTRFPLASVTKTFTAHLCLQTAFREHLDLPLKSVLPYFKLQDLEATRLMTPRDALCHFSGLTPHTSDWVRCELSRESYIRERLPRLPAAGPFREKHRYSNLMYAVLGQWLEVLDDRTWEDQVSEDLLIPLRMTHTGHLDAKWTGNAAPPHARTASGIIETIPPFYARKHHLIAPASELIGCMPDLARWGQFMLSLDPKDERWQPQNRISVEGPLDYGLGWRLDTVAGEPRCWHSGQCSGYSTLLTLYPLRKMGLAAAINCSNSVDALQALDVEACHTKF